jgi:hypothetical protein
MKFKENKKREALKKELVKSGINKVTAKNMAESVYPKQEFLNDSTFKFYLSGYIQSQSPKAKAFLNAAVLSKKQKATFMKAKRKLREVNSLVNQLKALST